MTRIERLLGAPAGEEVELPVDLIVTDDWTTPALLAPLEALGTERAAAPVVLVRDHTLPLERYEGEERERVARLRGIEEQFATRFGATLVRGRGIQHHVLPGSGLLRPGMVVLGNDSHAPTLGAYGVAAFAGQPTTIAAAIHTGRVVVRVPQTLRIRVVGRLRPGVSARDASLTLLGRLRDGGPVPRMATGKALEFCGPGLEHLNMAERAVLANATPEAVAFTATFPVDGRTLEALGCARQLEGREPCDPPADLVLDLGEVRPTLARSGRPDDVVALEQLPETRVDKVFVGTCAGGTYDEIRDFAEALRGRVAVASAIVAPASVAVEQRLRDDGILARMEEAGVTLLPPGCGPCFGFGPGRLTGDEVAVVTGNRNAIGRMGSARAKVHLGSGRTAGEAARTGRIGEASQQVIPNDTAVDEDASPAQRDGPRIVWPAGGNVVRLHGTVSTDDITPSAVPGIGTSSDPDPEVLRRLLFHHLDPSAATRDLRGAVVVAGENFGVGSNRASSVRALKHAGVAAVIARSVAPLYAMGARDDGLLVVVLDDEEFYRLLGPGVTVELEPGSGRLRVAGRAFSFAPASAYELALREAGGIVPYLLAQARRREPVGQGAVPGSR